jgi:acyl-CoA thioesterase
MTPTPQQAAEQAAQCLYDADRASQALGMRLIEVAPGFARVTMSVRADMTNGHGCCHGGLIFALADSAFAFACNSHGEPTVAAGAMIDFLSPVQVGEQLTASAREQWRGSRTGLYDIVVTAADEKIVALFRGRSHTLKRNG